MAGIGIELAGESFRGEMGNLVLCEPSVDAVAEGVAGGDVIFGEHVLVEGADHDEDIRTLGLKVFHQSAERRPLE